jgi:hypothetical protein
MKKIRKIYVSSIFLSAFFGACPAAQAGLLSPIIGLARPRIETEITKQCLEITAGTSIDLLLVMELPCKALAKPITNCFLVQIEESGKILSIFSELMNSSFGEASELIAKRCAAKLLNLPINTFAQVPLKLIIDRNKFKINDVNGSTSNKKFNDVPRQILQ